MARWHAYATAACAVVLALSVNLWAASSPSPAGAMRMMTWKITPQPSAVMVIGRSTVPTVYPSENDSVRFLASRDDFVWVMWEQKKTDDQVTSNVQKDLIEGAFMLCMDEQDKENSALSVDVKTLLVRQDDQPVGFLALGKETGSEAQRKALENLTSGDLGSFRFTMIVPSPTAPTTNVGTDGQDQQSAILFQRELLRRLANAKPSRLLVAHSEGAVDRLPAGLDPVAVMAGKHWMPEEIGRLTSLRVLSLEDVPPNSNLNALANLRELRSLTISGNANDNSELAIPSGLSLRRLATTEGALTGLGQQSGLEELTAPAELLAKLDLHQAFPKLIALSTEVSKLSSIPTGLKHIGFIEDKGVTPQLLASVVKQNPGLQCVEFMSCGEVADLSALKQLPDLNSLLLVKTKVANAQTLAELQNVHFIGLSAKDDGSALKELRTKRSDVVVVPVEGICLGSGWLLLLLPVIVIAAVVARRRSTALAAGAGAPV